MGTTSPQTVGRGNYIPWRGEKAAALVMMLVACALEFVIYVTFMLNFLKGGGWVNAIMLTALFVIVTPVVWVHYFGLRHLFRNQPVPEMTGLSLWFSLGTMNIANGSSSDPYSSLHDVIFVLLFIVCTLGAILTVRLNQRLRKPQPWNITLALGACQFIILNNALRLGDLAIITYTSVSRGRSISSYTSNVWLKWSDSGGTGLALTPSLILAVVITSLAAAGLYYGMRHPHSRAFPITAISAACLLTLYNIIILAAYGLPTSGGRAQSTSDTGIEALAILVIGAALIAFSFLAGRRPGAGSPTSLHTHSSYIASTPNQGMQSRFRQYGGPRSPMGSGY